MDMVQMITVMVQIKVQADARTIMKTALLGQSLVNAAIIRLICRKTAVNRAIKGAHRDRRDDQYHRVHQGRVEDLHKANYKDTTLYVQDMGHHQCDLIAV